MKRYHVILCDELGDEFSVEVNASDRDDAWDTVAMEYPESGVVAVLECGSESYRREASNRVFNSMWED